MSSPLLGPVLAFAGRLRFPTLFLITAGIFVFDLVIPDLVPFVDEILLGLGTLILSSWKSGRSDRGPPDLPPPAAR